MKQSLLKISRRNENGDLAVDRSTTEMMFNVTQYQQPSTYDNLKYTALVQYPHGKHKFDLLSIPCTLKLHVVQVCSLPIPEEYTGDNTYHYQHSILLSKGTVYIRPVMCENHWPYSFLLQCFAIFKVTQRGNDYLEDTCNLRNSTIASFLLPSLLKGHRIPLPS